MTDDPLDLYGECKMGTACECIQPIKRTSPLQFPPWLGRGCLNWQPCIPERLKRALEEK